LKSTPKPRKKIGLREGDKALLVTPKSKATVRVHLFEGVIPDVITMPRGLGHTAFNKEWALENKGININDLIGPVSDPASGLDMAWGIKAKLNKA